VGEFVVVEDHRVEAPGAQCDQPPLGRFEQRGADAAAALVGVHGEPVQVCAPAVPAGDHGAHDLPVDLGEQQRLGVPRDQRGDAVGVVADARPFRPDAPEREHRVDVRGCGGSDGDQRGVLSLGDQGRFHRSRANARGKEIQPRAFALDRRKERDARGARSEKAARYRPWASL
jgi:hypothetical protein